MSDDDLKATEGSGGSIPSYEDHKSLSSTGNNDYSLLWNEVRRINRRHHRFREELDRMGVAQLIILVLLIGDLIVTGVLIYFIL